MRASPSPDLNWRIGSGSGSFPLVDTIELKDGPSNNSGPERWLELRFCDRLLQRMPFTRQCTRTGFSSSPFLQDETRGVVNPVQEDRPRLAGEKLINGRSRALPMSIAVDNQNPSRR